MSKVWPCLARFYAEALYFGDGQHIGGLLPPVADNNVLTEAHAANVAARPAGRVHNCKSIFSLQDLTDYGHR